MKITVVYNQVTSLEHGDPQDILADEDTVKTAKEIAATLVSAGHQADLFEINEKTIPELLKKDTDFFFNNAYGIGSADKSEGDVADVLKRTGKPYSGSDSRAIILTDNKIATKKVLESQNLPTPAYQVFTEGTRWDQKMRFPLIIKPSNEHCSLGITEKSVVDNPVDLYERAEQLQQKYAEPVFAEEYIAGREANVTVLGNGAQAVALPISEIVFGPSFAGKYKIVDFAAKWEENSVAYKETVGVSPADLPGDLETQIRELAVRAVQVTGCYDYTRVDFRISEEWRPYILEVNANPAIGPNDGAIRSARVAGYTYPQFLQKVIDVALTRF
ncbi:ATP-grasp domain-containing protein [Patescibacteria group bacterium]|nr:ATP-grasp domain-containing protein [Patescibacteria group bacterium]